MEETEREISKGGGGGGRGSGESRKTWEERRERGREVKGMGKIEVEREGEMRIY